MSNLSQVNFNATWCEVCFDETHEHGKHFELKSDVLQKS